MQSSWSPQIAPNKTPSGIRRPATIQPFFILIGLLIFFGIVVIGGLYLVSAKSVVVMIDGTTREVRTHQGTVAALLGELQLTIDSQDTLSPTLDTPVRNGLQIAISHAKSIYVQVDGQIRTVRTRLSDTQAILTAEGIKLGPKDTVQTDDGIALIRIERAITVTVNDDGKTTTIQTTHRTVGEALEDGGFKLFLADSISPDLGAAIQDGATITIQRSVPLTIGVDGHTLNTRTHAKTVAAALADIGVAPVGLDYTVPALSTPITPNMLIRVVRITEEDDVQRTEIAFNSLRQPDPTLTLDTTQIIQAGIKGIRETRIRIRREDGIEVSRSAPETTIVQAERDEITAVGTLPKVQTMNTADGPIQYWRVLKMHAASYKPSSAGKSSDDPTYGITATGKQLHKGIVAVDPQLIPLGTVLYIPGYGVATADDTGGAVQGLVIDLGYSDSDYQIWSGSVEVYLLAPAPAPDQIPMLPTIEP